MEKNDCTIIVFHYESFNFLIGCINQIRKYSNAEVNQHIIIADQSGVYTYRKVINIFHGNNDISIVRMPQIDSGYSIDYVIRNVQIKTKYICTLDVDAFPINKNWLYAPIQLIKKYNYSFVGTSAFFQDNPSAYKEHGDFFCMSQFYRVGKTNAYKSLSMEVGFVRYADRNLTGFKYKYHGWNGWADCGVTAHWYEDKKYKNNKLSLATNRVLGKTPMQGYYGLIVDDLVFHFRESNNMKLHGSDAIRRYGEEYLMWFNKIENNGLTDDIIADMILKSEAIMLRERVCWDGDSRKEIKPVDEINEQINEFKNK